MSTDYERLISSQLNSMRQSLGALVGIAQGMLCDGVLNDAEILSLRQWFATNERLAHAWPGDVVYDKVKEVLSDGVITEQERNHLLKVLGDLIGAAPTDLAAAARVTELAYDDVERIDFQQRSFLFTGNFVHGPRKNCESEIKARGGVVSKVVTRNLNYLVIGGLGSAEWKHGSFGLKIEKVMQYKRERAPILVLKETIWRQAL